MFTRHIRRTRWLILFLSVLAVILLVLAINSGCSKPSPDRPFQIMYTSQSGGGWGRSSPDDETISHVIFSVASTLGSPLPGEDLDKYRLNGLSSPEGDTLCAVYAQPITLHSIEGTILANAKLLCIQLNRKDNKPDCLFYGKESNGLFEGKVIFPQIIDGGFQINGDTSALMKALSLW